jgi:hypothetical protein
MRGHVKTGMPDAQEYGDCIVVGAVDTGYGDCITIDTESKSVDTDFAMKKLNDTHRNNATTRTNDTTDRSIKTTGIVKPTDLNRNRSDQYL